MHPLLPDLAQLGQGKHLEPPAVGENRPLPAGKGMKPAQLPDQFLPGPYMEMVGIAKHHLAAQLRQIIGRNRPFDGAAGRHIHKGRRLNRAVRGFKYAAAAAPVRDRTVIWLIAFPPAF